MTTKRQFPSDDFLAKFKLGTWLDSRSTSLILTHFHPEDVMNLYIGCRERWCVGIILAMREQHSDHNDHKQIERFMLL